MVNVYSALPWEKWNFQLIEGRWIKKRQSKKRYYSQVITLDTETSFYTEEIGYVTDWSITIQDTVCIYGHKARDLIACIDKLLTTIGADYQHTVIMYIHNLAYDYVFIRNYLLEKYGEPDYALATKPHKYICMQWNAGLELRDSYILAGRSLEKWGKDLGVKTQKAVGKWDYSKFRTPGSARTSEEMEYMLIDTIAQNECIVKTMESRNVDITSIPLTKTGFVRKSGLKASRKDKSWRKTFNRTKLPLDLYLLLEEVYHGGYTHGNRHHIGEIYNNVQCYDFASSYPARLAYEKFPMGAFRQVPGQISIRTMLKTMDQIAYCGYLVITDLHLKKTEPMPPIAYHKCKAISGELLDNGKVVAADIAIVPFADPDLKWILRCYDYSKIAASNVWFTDKDYLPDWFTKDFMIPLYYNKCTLKGVDPLLYMISKEDLNSTYGMCVQKILSDDYKEIWETGEWPAVEKIRRDGERAQAMLDKFYKNRNKFLPYQWGVWVTAYAQDDLFNLGHCCDTWLYSDTDSVKGTGWDQEKVRQFNDHVIRKSKERGLGTIEYNNKTFVLGLAEDDGLYEEFKYMGSKRYAYRLGGKLHITVAGVPKNGVAALDNDLTNFRPGLIFPASVTGKTQVQYNVISGIKTIDIPVDNTVEKVEYGCSLRLFEADYILDASPVFDPVTDLPYSIIDIDTPF